MNGYDLTRVWEIDEHLVVADSIEDAIALMRIYCKLDKFYEPTCVKAVSTGVLIKNYDALIKEK